MDKKAKHGSLPTHFNKFHEFLMRNMAALEVHFHGQEQSEEELVALIETPTSIPPHRQCKEADHVTNPDLRVVTAVCPVMTQSTIIRNISIPVYVNVSILNFLSKWFSLCCSNHIYESKPEE